MKLIITTLLLCFLTLSLSAQIKAITQHGKTVILHENGTWEYENDKQENTPNHSSVSKITALNINDSIITTSSKEEIFNSVSKKLSRFFGKEKGKIKCIASCTNNKGEISMNLEFMASIGDANRYFGYSIEGRNITFHLDDGQNITSTLTDNIEQKFIEKWNISFYKGSCVLTKENIIELLNHKVTTITFDWKKTKEQYTVDTPNTIQNIIKQVL